MLQFIVVGEVFQQVLFVRALKKIKTNYEDVVAWIGPGISQKYFETDRDVYDLFNKKYNFLAKHFMYKNNKFYTDLIGITALIIEISWCSKNIW